ncbi:MAG: efflux RND transporter periplasmic adaptor subunit [Bacteroidota bacterium]
MKNSITKKLILLSSVVVLASCGGGEQSETNSEDSTSKKDLPAVAVVPLEYSQFQGSFEVQGSVEAEKNVLLNCETPGLIKRILAEEGQRVSAGQTLMILDADVIAKNIDEVEKSLELANFVYEKQKNLHEQNIGSELQFQQAKNNKERLEETLKTLRAQQSKSVVTAPFSGYIEQIFYKEGEMAMPQMPMIRLLDLSKVKIIANVMETYLPSVDMNKKVDISIGALNDTLIENVSLSRVGKYINPSNRTFEIEAKLDNKNERILPNLVAAVKVKNEIKDSVFVVPSASILQSTSGQDFVFVATKEKENYIVTKVIIKRGDTDKATKMTVVESGDGAASLSPGALVITEGARGVKAGMEVQVKRY